MLKSFPNYREYMTYKEFLNNEKKSMEQEWIRRDMTDEILEKEGQDDDS